MNKHELIKQIKASFSQIPYPGDSDVTYHPLGLDECFYDAIKGKKWQDLKSDILITHHDNIGLLTPNGFHYYLPAFLIEDLKARNGTVISEMLIIGFSSYATNRGSPLKDVSGRQWFDERMRLFSKEQVDSLINFISFYRTPEELLRQQEDIDSILNYLKGRLWETESP